MCHLNHEESKLFFFFFIEDILLKAKKKKYKWKYLKGEGEEKMQSSPRAGMAEWWWKNLRVSPPVIHLHTGYISPHVGEKNVRTAQNPWWSSIRGKSSITCFQGSFCSQASFFQLLIPVACMKMLMKLISNGWGTWVNAYAYICDM